MNYKFNITQHHDHVGNVMLRQAKGFCATIVTICFANKALHRVKKEEINKKKKTKLTI